MRLDADQLDGWVQQLADLEGRAGLDPADGAYTVAANPADAGRSDAARIDLIAGLERLKAACSAAQARLTHTLTDHQLASAAGSGESADDVRRSVAGQIALARRESPHTGRRHLGLARALVLDMPYALAAMTVGTLSEWRATLIARQLGCLTPGDGRSADAQLAPELGYLGDQRLSAAAARIAYRLDPAAVMARIRGAVTDRRVTIRPAPDTMTIISALLPVAHGVAAYAALHRHAAAVVADGDPRTRGQIMADELTRRLTAQPDLGCDPEGAPTRVSVTGENGRGGLELQIVITDRTLLDADTEPALITGPGLNPTPIPAPLARRLALADPATTVWVRRLYTHPDTGHLTHLDPRRRLFTAAARQFLITRDQTCRTPYCDAPIRHTDHITAHHTGGLTTLGNGQGLCENCNHTKQIRNWTATAHPDGTIHTHTPAGHEHVSTPPPLPQSPPWPDALRPVDYPVVRVTTSNSSRLAPVATGGLVGAPSGRACAARAPLPAHA